MKESSLEKAAAIGTLFFIAFAILIIILCSPKDTIKPNDEVVKVNRELIISRNWEKCNVDITCIDSLQESKGYYWCIYDNPDQFETTLCVSMNYNTYKELKYALRDYKCKGEITESIERKLKHFKLYYSNCEETVLMYE